MRRARVDGLVAARRARQRDVAAADEHDRSRARRPSRRWSWRGSRAEHRERSGRGEHLHDARGARRGGAAAVVEHLAGRGVHDLRLQVREARIGGAARRPSRCARGWPRPPRPGTARGGSASVSGSRSARRRPRCAAGVRRPPRRRRHPVPASASDEHAGGDASRRARCRRTKATTDDPRAAACRSSPPPARGVAGAPGRRPGHPSRQCTRALYAVVPEPDSASRAAVTRPGSAGRSARGSRRACP